MSGSQALASRLPQRRATRGAFSFLSAALLALSLPAVAGGQEVTVVRAARLLDVEEGRIVEPAAVVVEDGRIRSVGGPVPDGARTLELGDVTLLPGLMDMHVHLTRDLEGDWIHRVVTEGAGDAAVRGVRNAGRTLRAGFTTVQDVGSGGFVAMALMRGVERGLVEGPRVIPAGHAIGVTGGHCDVTGYAPGILELGPENGVTDGPGEVVEAVRTGPRAWRGYQIKHGQGHQDLRDRGRALLRGAGWSAAAHETRGRHRTTAEYFDMLSDAGFVHPEVRRSSRDKHLLIGNKVS